jgi:hypothetical protein
MCFKTQVTFWIQLINVIFAFTKLSFYISLCSAWWLLDWWVHPITTFWHQWCVPWVLLAQLQRWAALIPARAWCCQHFAANTDTDAVPDPSKDATTTVAGPQQCDLYGSTNLPCDSPTLVAMCTQSRGRRDVAMIGVIRVPRLYVVLHVYYLCSMY